jgi:hypothetical protein
MKTSTPARVVVVGHPEALLPAVFLSNIMLQQWTDEGKVRLDDTTLTLVAESRTVRLTPAVRFTKLIDGGDDPNKLLGKVKTKEQLEQLGAEHYMDSVILGDVGYTVLEGFMGDLSPAPRAPAPAESAAGSVAGAPAPSAPAPSAPAAPAMASSANAAVSPPSATAALPRTTTHPSAGPLVLPATPITEDEDEALALSALFLSTVRDK